MIFFSRKKPKPRLWKGLLVVFFFFSCNSLFAQQALPLLSKKITINFSGENMLTALHRIEQAAGFEFAFNAKNIEQYKVGSITYSNKTLEEILRGLFQNTPLTCKEVNGYLIINKAESKPVNPTPAKKPGKVTGKVIDEENGEPVSGATIRIGSAGTTTNMDGSFSISLANGNYVATVSYIGYGSKEVSEILIKDNETFLLDVTLKRNKGTLEGVVVKASAKKESTASFYTRQKNAASVTDGISFEQLNKLPDNNVGAVLKRISGVSVLDDKYVVIRGMSERYSQAMLDGMVLPSTDANKRNFAFDLIPNEMVSEILVNKTATPDASAEFVGGQVIVKTLDIPVRNFTTLSVGATTNTQTTGKDFMGLGKRQQGDYFAIEDGNRKIPDNAVSWTLYNQQEDPTKIVTTPTGYKYGYEGAIEQSKRFNPDGFKLYNSAALPNLNVKFIIGRVYEINKNRNWKLGFTGGITYRNRNQTDEYKTTRGLSVVPDFFSKEDTVGRGKIYSFNTNVAALFNAGFSSNNHKITIRNIYSRSLAEDYYRSLEFPEDMSNGRVMQSLIMPVFTSIQQHKLEGEHRITRKGLLVSWMTGFAKMEQSYNDVRSFSYSRSTNAFDDYYQQSNPSSNAVTQGAWAWPYRLWSNVNQKDYTWGVDISQPFQLLKGKSLVKIGYTGWDKSRSQSMNVFKVFAVDRGIGEYLPYHIQMDKDHIGVGKGQTYYWGDLENGDQASSSSQYHAAYLMLDQRFFTNRLRLVYGMRAENFGLANQQLAEVRRREQFAIEFPNTIYNGRAPELTGEKNWNYLPSINLTYAVTSKINLRVAYSKTMIRPTFRETALTSFPDPSQSAVVSGGNISSTSVDNTDLRFEWHPKPGDMLSVSIFTKQLDKPVELVVSSINTTPVSMAYKNQHSASSKGIELEFRKNLAFVSPLIKNFTFYGNGAYFISKVKTINKVDDPVTNKKIDIIKELSRPLMGQSPYLVNLGLLYEADGFSGNIVFNRSGYRPNFAVDGNPQLSEFRAAYSQLDLQLSKRFLKNKAELKMNITNLLNQEEFFYRNSKGYKVGTIDGQYQIIKLKYYVPGNSYFPPTQGNPDFSYADFTKLTDNYSANQGDQKTYSIKRGVSMSLAFSYNF